MTDNIRFDGRVAIVTGAGGQRPSLGRSHAYLLAERGAKVVVNDLGTGPDGRGGTPANAYQVAAEIVAAGGEAIADANSVAEPDTARAVVKTAIDAWGRIDILINNAGVVHLAGFDEISDADIQRIVGVHLMGSIWMCRAVWPHMKAAGYGRVVNTISGAIWGAPHVSIYGSAKGGVYALTRNLAVEGAPYGIKANALGPAAGTIATTHFNQQGAWVKMMTEQMPPELVSPAVAFLASEDCRLTGSCFEAGGGRVSVHVFGATHGYSNSPLTIENVRDNIEGILDRTSMQLVPEVTEPGPAPDLFVPKPYKPA